MTKDYDTLAAMLDHGRADHVGSDYYDDLCSVMTKTHDGRLYDVRTMVMHRILDCVQDEPEEAEDPKACYWMIY